MTKQEINATKKESPKDKNLSKISDKKARRQKGLASALRENLKRRKIKQS